MSASRFFLPQHQWKNPAPVLDAAESHHALDVLRVEKGARLTVFDGQGNEASAEVLGAARAGLSLKLLSRSASAPLRCAITLAQAVPKGKNMELIVEKAAELGASAIQPLLSERTIVRASDAGEAVRKQAKWQRTALEACKQCGQNWLPRVLEPRTPKAFLDARPRHDLMLVASLQPGALPLKTILAELPARPASVLILVGPEGDFTPAELSLAQSAGCRAVTLGPIVLRCETAAIYCLSVLAHELFS